jgi:predicted lipoprotein with Yx(FWY)xxD motif
MFIVRIRIGVSFRSYYHTYICKIRKEHEMKKRKIFFVSMAAAAITAFAAVPAAANAAAAPEYPTVLEDADSYTWITDRNGQIFCYGKGDVAHRSSRDTGTEIPFRL